MRRDVRGVVRRAGPAVLALASTCLAAAATEPARAPATAVAPGQVARWDGEGTTLCGMEKKAKTGQPEAEPTGETEETWAPLEGACFYPVDLLTLPGPLAVARWRGEAREVATLEVREPPYAEERLRVDERKVTLSPKNRERAKREAEEVAPLWASRGPGGFSLPLGKPLKGARKPRNFGVRRVFNGEARSPHGGADFTAARGTPVFAIAAGRVVLVANHFFSGRAVYLDHGDGLVSMVCHLSRAEVKVGDVVARGKRIGRSGASGRVSGPHLHLSVRWRGARIDPGAVLGDPGALPRIAP